MRREEGLWCSQVELYNFPAKQPWANQLNIPGTQFLPLEVGVISP